MKVAYHLVDAFDGATEDVSGLGQNHEVIHIPNIEDAFFMHHPDHGIIERREHHGAQQR